MVLVLMDHPAMELCHPDLVVEDLVSDNLDYLGEVFHLVSVSATLVEVLNQEVSILGF
jgi:hypothetical protein